MDVRTRKEVPHPPWTVLPTMCAVVGLHAIATAQDLRVAVPAALDAGRERWQAAADMLRQTPIERVVEAFTADSPLLEPRVWRASHGYVVARSRELTRCWRRRPDLREQATRLWVASQVDWVRLHAAAQPAERAQIERIAAASPTSDRLRRDHMFSADPGLSASARVLQRASVAAARGRAHPEIDAAMASDHHVTADQVALWDPFVVATYARDARPHVRAAAFAVLRRNRAHPLPPPLLAALAEHPNPYFRTLAINRPLTAEHFARAVARRDEEALQLLTAAQLDDIPRHARRTAAKRLFRAALAVKKDDERINGPSGPQLWRQGRPQRVLRRSRDRRAVALFTAAICCDEHSAELILGAAVNTRHAHVRARALTAVSNAAPNNSGLASMALALLDSRSEADRLSAARILDCATLAGIDDAVRARVLDRAQTVLAKRPTRLALTRSRSLFSCGPDRSRVGSPYDANSQIVMTAAMLGMGELLDPLLDALQPIAGQPGCDPMFVARALTPLVETSDDKQLTRMLALVPGLLGSAVSLINQGQVMKPLVARLLARSPDVSLPKLAECMLGQREGWFWNGIVFPMRAELTPAARRFALTAHHQPGRRLPPAMLATSPERMRFMSERGQGPTKFATDCIAAALQADVPLTREEAEALPRELLVAAVRRPRVRVPAHVIALVSAERRLSVRDLVRRANLDENSVQALRTLTGSMPVATAITYAWPAAPLGEPGRVLAMELLQRAIDDGDASTRTAAIEFAVRHGLEPNGWRQVAGDITPGARSWARVRFGDADPAELGAMLYHYLLTTGEDVDAAALRASQPPPHALARLVAHPGRGVRIGALQAAAEQPIWRPTLQRAVATALSASDADVRQAAYAGACNARPAAVGAGRARLRGGARPGPERARGRSARVIACTDAGSAHRPGSPIGQLPISSLTRPYSSYTLTSASIMIAACTPTQRLTSASNQ